MAGLDPDPQHQLQPQNQTLVFNKGQEVEVSSDEDGFRGAWYVASIVEYPPKSTSKKRKKALIQYKTLLAEDGSSPLTEHVDPAYIRPLPPNNSAPESGDQVFEENDHVDAGYRDGWWTGVVRKTLEGSRCRVYFDNPPDVIDFDAKDLRFHWEWLNGNWVRPEKQPTTGSIFHSGMTVEVNLDKENVCDAWFPAVVIKENGDETFLVKCQSSKNNDEAGTIKVTVDSPHIRPTPPRYADRNYELLEKVDTQYDFGWRAGVITKLLAGRRYNVFFKQGNEDKELDHSEMRPHVEWVDGKWIGKSKEAMIVSDNQEQLDDAHNSDGNLEVAVQLEKPGAAEDTIKEITPSSVNIGILMDQAIHCDEKSPPQAKAAMPPSKKKLKWTSPNDNGMRWSRPSKKLNEVDAAEDPLALQSKRMVESSILKTLHELTTPKSAGKRTRWSKKPVIGDQSSAKTKSFATGKTVKTKQQKVVALDVQKIDNVTRTGRRIKSPFERLQASAPVKKKIAVDAVAKDINRSEGKNKEAEGPFILGLEAKGMMGLQLNHCSHLPDERKLRLLRDQKKNLHDLVEDKSMELNLQKSGGSSQRRKRGRPRKIVISEAGKELIAGDIANETIVEDHTTNELQLPTQTRVDKVSQNASGEKTVDDSERDCTTKKVDMAITGMTKNMADDDQPLSTWFGGMHSSASVEDLRLPSSRSTLGWNETRERQIVAVESGAINAKSNGMLDKNQCLPFVKKSPVWETIESMEVFKILPQKPHFCPLTECKEEYREGSAIGVMVTFASLFEKISSLQIDDSRSILESTLESLLDLEKHGFDVNVPQNRVNELLVIKDGQRELLTESEDAERQIREHSDEKTKLDEKMNDIENKIAELQEDLAAYKSKMETKDLEIATFQLRADAVNERIANARHNFEKVATASWKLP